MDPIQEIFHRHAQTLEPIPTAVDSRLVDLTGIRCVLFDVYGTLLISGSGDVGTSVEETQTRAIEDAMQAVALRPGCAAEQVALRLRDAIRADHESKRQAGVSYPEVDILEIWKDVLESLGIASSSSQIAELAAEYEARVNPTWSMPGAVTAIEMLQSAGVELGIISNAQFYTKSLFEVHLAADLSKLGFSLELCFFSYEGGESKPSLAMFHSAMAVAQRKGFSPHEIVYVGNDMRNDIYPASQLDWRTALFAGDARSLRMRESDRRTVGLEPTLVVKTWDEFVGCILSPKR